MSRVLQPARLSRWAAAVIVLAGIAWSADGAAQNLITNGSFETNTASTNFLFAPYPSTVTASGWSAVNFDGEIFSFEDVMAPSGPFYADLLQNPRGNPRTPWNETSHNATGIGYDRIVQLVDVQPNTTYTVTFSHRGGNRLDYVGEQTLVQFQSMSTTLYQDALVETPDAWSPQVLTFRTDATTTRAAVLFSPFGLGPSSVLLDAVTLRDASAGCGNGVVDDGETCDDGGIFGGDGCSATCQLEPAWTCGTPIVNGGFELGPGGNDLTGAQLPGWTIEAGSVDQSVYPHTEGQRAIDLTGCQPGTISQVFATLPGEEYTLRLDYGSNTYLNNRFAVELVSLPSGDIITSQTFSADPTVGNALNAGSVSFTATSGQTRLRLRTEASQSCGGNWIDNVRLDQVCFTQCGNGVLDEGEGCDDGAANGATPCGCQVGCQLTAAGASCPQGVCNGEPAAPACVECLSDAQCGGDRLICDINNNICVSCLDDAGCDDGNGCTVNTCEAGRCVFPPEPARTTCDGGICDGDPGSPECVECLASADCADDNPCTRDLCFDGSCADVVESAGTACGDGGVCNGSLTESACVECLSDAQCGVDQRCTLALTCELPDSDGDGIRDDLDLDDDNDGIPDQEELGGVDLSGDMDGDGVFDWRDADSGCADGDGDGVCDALPASVDADGDGIPNHLDRDADGDGITDTVEGGGVDDDRDGVVDGLVDLNRDGLHDPLQPDPLPLPDTDEDSAPDFLDRDSDGDGLTDAREAGAMDVDGDGAPDGAGVDADGDGLRDDLAGPGALPQPDTDMDGAPDWRDRDSDGDGSPDAVEAFDVDGDGAADLPALDVAPEPDHDGDSLPDWRDPEDDGDGLTTQEEDVNNDGDPRDDDTDGDGTPDYLDLDDDGDGVDTADDNCPRVENPDQADSDGDGVGDACTDRDGDGVPDEEEEAVGTDPDDADSDDDGVADGEEPRWDEDSDGDGLINALDPDSDNDGILDGTELGVTEATRPADTDLSAGHFRPDADPTTTTDPLDADTDAGGVDDGAEDPDHNGRVDEGELDPNASADDAAPADSDGDGLSDAEEAAAGTDPADADSDDDGVLDGAEDNWSDDTDGDGLINALDSDSDDDGLFDGTERGVTTPSADTDVTAGAFIPDADPTTTTFMVVGDTDRGGILDGVEDFNRDGRVDAGELDPRVGEDDVAGGPCSAGLGACRAEGTLVDVGGVIRCDATPGAPGEEVCDTLDNDCDGVADEGEVCEEPADRDGDGVTDEADSCPDVANPGQEDADGDGVGDACDAAPAEDTITYTVEGSTLSCATGPGRSTGIVGLLLGLLAFLGLRRR